MISCLSPAVFNFSISRCFSVFSGCVVGLRLLLKYFTPRCLSESTSQFLTVCLRRSRYQSLCPLRLSTAIVFVVSLFFRHLSLQTFVCQSLRAVFSFAHNFQFQVFVFVCCLHFSTVVLLWWRLVVVFSTVQDSSMPGAIFLHRIASFGNPKFGMQSLDSQIWESRTR